MTPVPDKKPFNPLNKIQLWVSVGIWLLLYFVSCRNSDDPTVIDPSGSDTTVTTPDTTQTSAITLDTIAPLDYFPAFPGSYWVYNGTDSLIVSNSYQEYIFNSAWYTAPEDLDTLVLPELILNGVFNPGDSLAYVQGYSISKAIVSSYRDPAFKGILSETEGDIFEIGAAFQYHKISGKTIKVDTSITVNSITYDSVLITIEYDEGCHTQGGFPIDSCATKREYFAKGVGLIKREVGGYIPSPSWTTTLELTSYFINN